MSVRATKAGRLALLTISAAAVLFATEQQKIDKSGVNGEDCCSVDFSALTSGVGSHPSVLSQEPDRRLVEGNAKSEVRVVIYEDLQCPDCAAFRQMIDTHLLPRFGNRVAFEHRDFPLPKHDWARKAAITARLLDDTSPELGAKFRSQTLSRIREINSVGFENWLAGFAAAHRLDRKKLALPDAKYGDAVERDFQEGIRKGVARTPTVFVAGEPFVERFTVEAIAAAIEQALEGNPKGRVGRGAVRP